MKSEFEKLSLEKAIKVLEEAREDILKQIDENCKEYVALCKRMAKMRSQIKE